MKQQIDRKILITGIVCLAAFLLFYKLDSYMSFIGDQGWFYLSARDMLLTGHIPLLGITSSHTWLHQGPLWTYLLAIALRIGNFNPLAGGYFTATIGLFTVWLIYKIASEIFSHRVGLIASLLYATSPLIIQTARTPYHTSFISTFALLWFYTLYKWINGFTYGFPLLLFLFAILYNFELSTVMLVPVFLCVCIYGYIKKTKWIRNLLNYKLTLWSIVAVVVPMLPMILYDIHHGYPQTIKFALWLGYNALTFFGLPKIHPLSLSEPFPSMLSFASSLLSLLIFSLNSIVAWLLLAISLFNLILLNKTAFQKNFFLQPYSLLLLFFIIPAAVYIADRTNSMAYWPLFYPSVIFMLALLFDNLINIKGFFYPVIFLLAFYAVYNITIVIQTNFLTSNSPNYSALLSQAKQIIYESNGVQYNLIGKGNGSQYESFTMNYEYLTWWLGHGPSKSKQKLGFIIEGKNGKYIITKENIRF